MKRNKSIIAISQYVYKVLGCQLAITLLLNIGVTILDVFGITMFIPLIGYVLGFETNLGGLKIIPQYFQEIGLPLDLYSVLLVSIFIFTLKTIYVYYKDLYFIKVRFKTIKKMRYAIFDKISRLSYNGYVKTSPAELQFAAVGEMNRSLQSIVQFVSFAQSIIIAFTYLMIAIYANWTFATLILCCVGLISIIYSFLGKKINKQATQISKSGKVFNSYMIQTINNFKYLKITNTHDFLNTRLRKSVDDYELKYFEIAKINSISSLIREPLMVIIISIVLLIYIKLLNGDSEGLFISLLIFYRALSKLMIAQNSWTLLNGFYPSTLAVEEFIEKLEKNSEAKQVNKSIVINKIELNSLSVVYDKKQVLKNISLTIEGVKTIALVGESGAGKTTLANVICGLMQPDKGSLLVNDETINQEYLYSYRDRIGFVTQEPTIFDDTIFDNVTLGGLRTPENVENFWRCINLVHLTSLVESLEQKENTQIGSNGVLISGGQKQRISIARELYRNIDLLILDEATSALDSETEEVIKQNIESVKDQYMMIIIAHRLSTIKSADIIYLLENGEIIHKGDFKSLYINSPKFKKMVDLQEIQND